MGHAGKPALPALWLRRRCGSAARETVAFGVAVGAVVGALVGAVVGAVCVDVTVDVTVDLRGGRRVPSPTSRRRAWYRRRLARRGGRRDVEISRSARSCRHTVLLQTIVSRAQLPRGKTSKPSLFVSVNDCGGCGVPFATTVASSTSLFTCAPPKLIDPVDILPRRERRYNIVTIHRRKFVVGRPDAVHRDRHCGHGGRSHCGRRDGRLDNRGRWCGSHGLGSAGRSGRRHSRCNVGSGSWADGYRRVSRPIAAMFVSPAPMYQDS